ncbi:hypothetical protein [Anaerostipes faecalis]|uniref:hypothetical protein n=1 Tax=Anaerostipes faecalis TaxID=2738446 RepID=UPI001C1E46D8|nr:hypothetical protein [Anaerostipes faecalis]
MPEYILKRRVSWKPLLIGAIGFIVSARVLELDVHMFCIVLDTPVSRFIVEASWQRL